MAAAAALVPTSVSPRPGDGRGTPLPTEIRRLAEEVFGADLSEVRVYRSAKARQMRALAFTCGPDIHFAPGAYDPGSERGLRLIGHEIAHVIQQRRGAVRNPYGYGVAVVRDPALENEADRLADVLVTRARRPSALAGGAAIQRAQQDDSVVEIIDTERRRLLLKIRQVIGGNAAMDVLCFGASKNLVQVYLATDAGEYAFVSLDPNFVAARIGQFTQFGITVNIQDRTSIGDTTDVLKGTIGTGIHTHAITIRLYDLSYSDFFVKIAARRRDVLFDKASWLYDFPEAWGRYLATLRVGGWLITDNNLGYGVAAWAPALFGLTDETHRLGLEANIGFGYGTAHLYQRQHDLGDCLSVLAMRYYAAVRLVLKYWVARTPMEPDVGAGLQEQLQSGVKVLRAADYPWPNVLRTSYEQCLDWIGQLRERWEQDQKEIEEQKSREEDVVAGPLVLQGTQILSQFEVSVEALRLGLAEREVITRKALYGGGRWRVIGVKMPAEGSKLLATYTLEKVE